MKSKSKYSDWRITKAGKPSKKWINYLKNAAKIRRDLQIELKTTKNKEIANLYYKSTLNDLKDYSKRGYFDKKTENLQELLEFIIELQSNRFAFSLLPQKKQVIILKKKKTVKPKKKTGSKKTKITKTKK